ncbi:uncharacterized protein LOC126064689 isoform X6 [Elephas maximus indicus]|uniref:uncharacterized protein LOC126064689 isoform X6 n=1 Tax=Elephas maximus indicus TaxID=99487 RepID=UPI002116C285|nr:uncharacterized protein LOC126064689 isoform X6 [Elephas maximus indicus]
MAGYARLSRIPPELVDVCPSWKSFLPPVQWQLGWVNAHPHCASVTWGLLYPQGQQYLPQEGWTREESSRREVRGSPVQGRGTAKTMNWKFIPYSVRDHVYFRGNTCVLGAPPSCGPSPGSEVWMVPRDPELHRGTGGKERSHSSGPGEGPSLLRGSEVWMVPRDPELHRGTGGKERSHSSGPGEGPSLLRGWAHPFDHRKGSDLWGPWCSLAHTQKDQNTMGQQYLTQEEGAEFKIRGPGFWSPGGGKGDPYFFCWLVPHGVTGGWCPEILSSTKGQVGETEVAAQDVEQFQHFQEAGLIHLITGRVLTYGDLGVLLYTLGRIKTPGDTRPNISLGERILKANHSALPTVLIG